MKHPGRTFSLLSLLLLLCSGCAYHWPQCPDVDTCRVTVDLVCIDGSDTLRHDLARGDASLFRHYICLTDSATCHVIESRMATTTTAIHSAVFEVEKGTAYVVHTWSDHSGFDISDPRNIAIPNCDPQAPHHGAPAYHGRRSFVASDSLARIPVAATDPQSRLLCIATDASAPSSLRCATLNHTGYRPDIFSLLSGCAVDASPGVAVQCLPWYDAVAGGIVIAGDVCFTPAADSTRITVSITVEHPDGRRASTPAFTVPLRRGGLTIARAPFISIATFQPGSASSGGVGIDPSFDGSIDIVIE